MTNASLVAAVTCATGDDVRFFLLAISSHMIVHGLIKANAIGGLEGAARQRGRDILVACNKAVSTFSSRDRNVASPLGGMLGTDPD